MDADRLVRRDLGDERGGAWVGGDDIALVDRLIHEIPPIPKPDDADSG